MMSKAYASMSREELLSLKEELDKQRVSNASEEQLEAGTSAKAASKKKAVE